MAAVKTNGSWYMAWRILRAALLLGFWFLVLSVLIVGSVWGLAALFGVGGTEWVGVINIFPVILILVMVTGTLLIVAERKWASRIQNRIGPNRARFWKDKGGPLYALPHLIADALKMLAKEDFNPPLADKFFFKLAPAMALVPAFILIAVIPIGPDIEAFGTAVRFQVARLDMGMIYVFAIASLAVYGTTLAGWSSNNKFAILGGLRASAQMISYEVTLGLTVVGAFMIYQTLRPEVMVAWQDDVAWGFVPMWGVFFQPFAFLFFLVAAFAEVKRAPFDLPEGESEIVGYFIEYSGMKFGIFMLSEFLEIVVLSTIITALFFGGWSIPWLPTETLYASLAEGLGADWGALLTGLIGVFVFVTKTIFFVWLQMMIRWTFPRFRYDQIMDLGWKMLLPLALANVVITAVAIVVDPGLDVLLAVGLVELVVLAAVMFSAAAPARDDVEPAEEHAAHGGAMQPAHASGD